MTTHHSAVFFFVRSDSRHAWQLEREQSAKGSISSYTRRCKSNSLAVTVIKNTVLETCHWNKMDWWLYYNLKERAARQLSEKGGKQHAILTPNTSSTENNMTIISTKFSSQELSTFCMPSSWHSLAIHPHGTHYNKLEFLPNHPSFLPSISNMDTSSINMEQNMDTSSINMEESNWSRSTLTIAAIINELSRCSIHFLIKSL